MWPNELSRVDVPTLKFVFWARTSLPKRIYGKSKCNFQLHNVLLSMHSYNSHT